MTGTGTLRVMSRVPIRAGRAVPGVVWLITGLYLVVMVWQTAVFPNLRSPDERQHVDLIVMVHEGKAWPWPAQGTMSMSQGSAAGGFTKANTIRHRLHLADQGIPARDARPSYLDRGGTEVTGQPKNQLIQHPPLYYLAGAAVLALIPDWHDAPFDRVYLLLRLWNALLMVALPILCWATARRLGLPDPLPVAAALVPVAIPELTRSASSVNNDNMFTPLIAVLTLLVVRVLTGDTSRRTALAIGGVGSLALLTKGFGLVVPAWVALVYLVAAVRSRRVRGAAGSLAVAGAAMTPGLAWWVRNKVVYGTVQPHGLYTENPDMTPRYGWSDGGWAWLTRLAERMNTLFFVHDQTGQRQHHGPYWMAVIAGLLVLTGLVVVLALRVLPRSTTLLLLVPPAGIFAIVAKGSWDQYAYNHVFAGMQGRYLFAGLVGIAVVAVAAAARLPAAARRWAPLAVLVFGAAIHVVYLQYTVWLFWAPRGIRGIAAAWESLRAIHHWYAFPTPALLLIVLLAAVALVATVVALLRVGRRGPDQDPPAPGDGLGQTEPAGVSGVPAPRQAEGEAVPVTGPGVP